MCPILGIWNDWAGDSFLEAKYGINESEKDSIWVHFSSNWSCYINKVEYNKNSDQYRVYIGEGTDENYIIQYFRIGSDAQKENVKLTFLNTTLLGDHEESSLYKMLSGINNDTIFKAPDILSLF
jgi:hypothetical protein